MSFIDTPTNIMIDLIKFNNEEFTLNAILIEQIESLPDTTITLTNGKKILVKNSREEVVQLITKFYQKIGLQNFDMQVGDGNE